MDTLFTQPLARILVVLLIAIAVLRSVAAFWQLFVWCEVGEWILTLKKIYSQKKDIIDFSNPTESREKEIRIEWYQGP